MIKTAMSILFLFSVTANAQDIFLQTRMEQKTLSALIDKTRILLSNKSINDRLSGEIEYHEDIYFALSDAVKDEQYSKFSKLFNSVFKLDLSNATLRIRIPKIGYQVEELHANPTDLAVRDPILDLGVTASIRGLSTTLNSGIDFDLMITNPKTNESKSYLSAHLNSTTIQIPDTIEPLDFNLRLETKLDQEFTYNLKSYDLSSVPNYVNLHLNEFNLIDNERQKTISADSIQVNPVTIRLGSLTRTIQFDSFKPLLQKRMNKILTSIISKLGVSIQNKIGPKILKGVFSNKTRSSLVIKNDHFFTNFEISNFSQPISNQLYLGVIGGLCTTESFQQYHEQCNEPDSPAPVRSISDGDRLNAKSEITEHIARGNSDLVLSVSEEYMNRLLHTTIQANLWTAALEKQHLALGPKGAFVIFNQRSPTPELYIDLLYMGDGKKGISNLLVNEDKPIRFPMRISTSVDFINQDGTPHMIVKTLKVLSDANEIIHGIPEYGLQSHLVGGFKKKIANMILELSAGIEGQTAIDIELPVLKNIDIEKTWHEASPFGRFNLFFKL